MISLNLLAFVVVCCKSINQSVYFVCKFLWEWTRAKGLLKNFERANCPHFINHPTMEPAKLLMQLVRHNGEKQPPPTCTAACCCNEKTMLSLRVSARHLRRFSSTRYLSSTSLTQAEKDEEDNKLREALEAEKSHVQKYVEKSRALDPTMVWGTIVAPPDPELPSDPSEVAALDPSHMDQDPLTLTGEKRVVHIKQEVAKTSQAPTTIEQTWIISFSDEGESAQCWDNPLMGWVSSSDTMASNMRLQMPFDNAEDAVYFAKKRGWDYVVEKPIMRKGRADDAQYQDNFLSQAVASRVRKEKKKCDQWYRDESGTSHYTRPLKYHGDGTVQQYGPNGDAEVAPHVPGYYKLR